MSLRLHEMHPALVHLPIALLPTAVAADALGQATDNSSLLSFGRAAIAVTAAGAAASVLSGLIAGEEVNVEGRSRDMLMTHRNLNVAAAVIATCMALWRFRRKRPTGAYLAVGAAGAGVLGYTAYLGGELVYKHGVGVAPAKGVYRPDAPSLRKGQLGAFFGDAATDLRHGVEHMVEELEDGLIIPAIVGGSGKVDNAGAPAVAPRAAPAAVD
jgi:uncharacterized membrane protein